MHQTLLQDPVAAYGTMDTESREAYRRVIGDLGKRSSLSENEIAAAAVNLASRPAEMERQRHVGFYLLEDGRETLELRTDYQPSTLRKIQMLLLNHPTAFYLLGVELTTFIIVAWLLSHLPSLTPILAGLALLLLPATHGAVNFMNILTSKLAPPRFLPKLDFSKGVPEEFTTVVAVPALLLNETQTRDLVRNLEVRFLCNDDPNIYFGLLTDSPDSAERVDPHENDMTAKACEMILELNARHGKDQPRFFLLHRYHHYNPSEGAWMGWERKRGKILDLNRYLRGATERFPIRCGAVNEIRRAKFVLSLDSDTQLPPGAAAKMIGTLAHPLNRAVLDEQTNVVAGYGILQPRVSVSIQSASRSRLANLYSGQTGFDIYTHAISDVYQDLFGEGIFTGKGIYDIDVFRRVLENRFPSNQLLSHDLIEGIYARAGLVSDIEVVDDYPSHYSAYTRRQHRWVRGDWQILKWLLPVVPNFVGHLIPNPISVISRWKILDNVRRSLIRPAMLLLILAGWFGLPGPPVFWTLASVALLLIPAYAPLLFPSLSTPKLELTWLDIRNLVKGHAAVLLELTFLVEQALSSLDAIVRSVVRTRFTRRKMLEWETAAQAESHRPQALSHRYLYELVDGGRGRFGPAAVGLPPGFAPRGMAAVDTVGAGSALLQVDEPGARAWSARDRKGRGAVAGLGGALLALLRRVQQRAPPLSDSGQREGGWYRGSSHLTDESRPVAECPRGRLGTRLHHARPVY